MKGRFNIILQQYVIIYREVRKVLGSRDSSRVEKSHNLNYRLLSAACALLEELIIGTEILPNVSYLFLTFIFIHIF